MSSENKSSLYSFELEISPHGFRVSALPLQPILLSIEPQNGEKGAVLMVRQNNAAELFEHIYKELGEIIKKYDIESLPVSQPEKCFSEATSNMPGIHFRFAYGDGRNWTFYYPSNNAPARILDLISACKILTRKVFDDQPGDQISGTEALEYVKTEGTEDVIPKINKYIYEHPNDAQAYNDRGMEYLRLQDNGKAIEDFTTAIELNPKFDRAYFNRSWVFHSQAEWEKAIADLSKAIELNPKMHEAYNNRGLIHGIKKEYEKGIDDFKKAISCAPDSETAYANLANAYYNLKDCDQALIFYNKAIERAPDSAKYYADRGKVYDYLKKYGLALKDYSRAIEIDPNYVHAYYIRAMILMDMGNFGSAKNDFSKVIEISPDESYAYMNRAYCSLKEADAVNAIADCDTAIAKDPSNWFAYFYRAQAKKFQERPSETLKDIKIAEEVGLYLIQKAKEKSNTSKNVNQGKTVRRAGVPFKSWWELNYQEKFTRSIYLGVFAILIMPIVLKLMGQPLNVILIFVAPFALAAIINLLYAHSGRKKELAIKKREESIRASAKLVSIESLGLEKFLFLTLKTDKAQAYINEQVSVIVKVHTNKLSLIEIQSPSLCKNEFSEAHFGDPKQYIEEIDGLKYDILEFKALISGAQQGRYKVGFAKSQCYVLIAKPENLNEAYLTEIKAQEVEIDILPKSAP
jgi:tetratricopeptide (TPR) repeat protein